MTWNSSCSIASDDENSRQSFLSDCDSEFDLRPPPRYPAEKRLYSTSKKQSINRIEPPMTRSRAKAIGQTIDTLEPLPKQKRHSALRRSIDAFTGMATTLTSSLNNNSILFSKQDTLTLPSNDRNFSPPLDGVNILADRFESCSLDEGKLNRNCVWPSRETNSRYMRPLTSPCQTNLFGANPYSTYNNSPVLSQTSTPIVFGQQQAQLWSRFRFAASTLRNSLWLEQTDLTLQQVPSNVFSNNFNNNNSLFISSNQSSMLLSPQTVPTRLMNPQNKSSSMEDESSSSVFRQRKVPSANDTITPVTVKENTIKQQLSISKILFTLTIFIIGIVLGYLLTNTLPPGLVWEICVKYFFLVYGYLQNIMKYFASIKLT